MPVVIRFSRYSYGYILSYSNYILASFILVICSGHRNRSGSSAAENKQNSSQQNRQCHGEFHENGSHSRKSASYSQRIRNAYRQPDRDNNITSRRFPEPDNQPQNKEGERRENKMEDQVVSALSYARGDSKERPECKPQGRQNSGDDTEPIWTFAEI